MAATYSIIGQPIPARVDGTGKVTGVTRYADDLFLPRMLYRKLLRSPHPHARILHVDTRKATALPGVFAVITGADLPQPYNIMPVNQDEHTLAIDKVRYVGDPVAAVAAVDEATAETALHHIEVAYEPLRALMPIEDALTYPEDRIHDYNREGNVHRVVALEFGPGGSTGAPGQSGARHCHTSGEGFGDKSDMFAHEFCAAKLSMLTGRPVKIRLTREEVFYAHRGRHPVLMWVRTGVKRNGTITALHLRTFVDGGGYSSYGVASVLYTGALQTVTYKIPHYRFEGLRIFTNKPPCGPKRGQGTPQPRFALEVHLDKIAADLGLTPVQLQRPYLVTPFSMTVNHLRITSCGLGDCIDAVVQRSEFLDKAGRLPFGHGIGRACSSYLIGAGVTLTQFSEQPEIVIGYPALATAASRVPTPQLRNMGTLGGNLCVDTRCNYYNQTYWWREAIGFCLKKDGHTCWVAPGSARCWAVSSSDTAPVLIALNAQVRLVGPAGERTVPVHDLYCDDGMRYLGKRHAEIVTHILLPPVAPGLVMRYVKIRRRGAFDFPILGVAVALRMDEVGLCTAARVVLGAVASAPLLAARAAAVLVGQRLTPEVIDAAAQAAFQLAKPLDNTDLTLSYRKKMVRVPVARVLCQLAGLPDAP